MPNGLIDSSLFGIPFEGFDSYNDGVGSKITSIPQETNKVANFLYFL
jgi:hypothetical protein